MFSVGSGEPDFAIEYGEQLVAIETRKEKEEARYLIMAHHEYSAYSPLWAYWHLQAKRMDFEAGIRQTALVLAECEAFEPADRAWWPIDRDVELSATRSNVIEAY